LANKFGYHENYPNKKYVREERGMKISIVWILIGGMVLTACGGAPVSSPTIRVPPPIQPISPVISPVSPLPTAIIKVSQAEADQISPLPSPVPESIGTPSTGRMRRGIGELTPATIGDAALIFQRTGGLMGVADHWSIFPDGRIVANNGQEVQVEPERIQQLLTDVKSLGFFEMNKAYMPKNTCCDRFTYIIIARDADKIHSVTTIDAAPNAPPALWQIIEAIHRLIRDTYKK
jgi:hypothetical protein